MESKTVAQVKPSIAKKIVIEDDFEEHAIQLSKAIGTKEDVETLKKNFKNFKEDIEKMNNGQMDYATMRSLYG